MKRRKLLLALGALALLAQSRARAQSAREPQRIGWLSIASSKDKTGFEQFKLQMKALGYVEGRDVLTEGRFADGTAERLPALARELVALKPAVVVAHLNDAVAAAMQATRDIPIVMLAGTSPVETGFVKSLARPGGNVTGATYNPLEIAGKTVELVKAAAPHVSRMTVVWTPDAPGMRLYKPFADRAAQALGIALHYVDIHRPEDFRVESLRRGRPEAIYVAMRASALQTTTIRFALEHKLPSVGATRAFAEAGGLLSLGSDPSETWRIGADYVDRILKGAKPADLPIQQPSKFEIIVNRKTARAIGLTIPQALLLQADEVIE